MIPSLQPITFELTPSPAPSGEAAALAEICDWMVADNLEWMQRAIRAGRIVPCSVACAKVRYQAPSASDYQHAIIRIKGAARLLQTRRGDCGSLACYDAAAALLRGVSALVQIVGDIPRSDYHAIVSSDVGSWDPSRERSPLCGCRSSLSVAG